MTSWHAFRINIDFTFTNISNYRLDKYTSFIILDFIRLHTSQIIDWISIHHLLFTVDYIYKMYYRPLSPLPT